MLDGFAGAPLPTDLHFQRAASGFPADCDVLDELSGDPLAIPVLGRGCSPYPWQFCAELCHFALLLSARDLGLLFLFCPPLFPAQALKFFESLVPLLFERRGD